MEERRGREGRRVKLTMHVKELRDMQSNRVTLSQASLLTAAYVYPSLNMCSSHQHWEGLKR